MSDSLFADTSAMASEAFAPAQADSAGVSGRPHRDLAVPLPIATETVADCATVTTDRATVTANRAAAGEAPLSSGSDKLVAIDDGGGIAHARAAPAKARKRPRPGERRMQILQMLAEMLETPHVDRVTTAALAARLEVSEAALYRHFASKAQMFEGLIAFIEETLFGLINQVTSEETDGFEQLRAILTLLLTFSERNPGMTRVLIGDALVTEADRLQDRINQLIDRLEVSIKQCFRTLIVQQKLPPDTDSAVRANLMMSFVLGRWLRYSKGGFKCPPTDWVEAQAALLIRG